MNCLKIVAKTGMHQAINCGDLILSMPIQYKPVNSSDSKLPKHSLPMAILIYWNCDIYWDSKPLYEGLLTRKHRHLSQFYDIMVLHATCIILNTILVDTSLLSSAYFSGIPFVSFCLVMPSLYWFVCTHAILLSDPVLVYTHDSSWFSQVQSLLATICDTTSIAEVELKVVF